MYTTLIVGADSGIGAALLARIPNSVGTSRRADSLHIQLDVESDKPWPTFDQQFTDVYYCIAVNGLSSLPSDVMNINATKSYQCLEHIAPYVVNGGTIRVLTSIMGSLTKGFIMPAAEANVYYRMSKAALNIAVLELSKQYANINWQLVHPGFVKTKFVKHLAYIEEAMDTSIAADKIVAIPKIPGVSYIEIDTTGTRLVI
jgi:NAD(P)-dependent dehydrogenase (short-subunit alcohol dehydrogenase family)